MVAYDDDVDDDEEKDAWRQWVDYYMRLELRMNDCSESGCSLALTIYVERGKYINIKQVEGFVLCFSIMFM